MFFNDIKYFLCPAGLILFLTQMVLMHFFLTSTFLLLWHRESTKQRFYLGNEKLGIVEDFFMHLHYY